MSKNVGKLDQIIRFAAGALLQVIALFSGLELFDGDVVKTFSIIVGLVLVGTAAVNFCPLYRLLGVNTCKS